MKVAHLCTGDFVGGAARSAYRIHTLARKAALSSVLVVRDKSLDDASVIRVRPENDEEQAFYDERRGRVDTIEAQHFNTVAEGHYFKSDWGKEGGSIRRIVEKADLIHIHWVSNNFLDYKTFFAPGVSPKPIIWRLPDMNPITGGCHFSAGCDGFKSNCGYCPALGSEQADDISREIHTRKAKALLNYPGKIEFVATNKWMKRIVASSSIGQHFPVHVIHNGVDTGAFAPQCISQSKKELGVDDKVTTILFVAANLSAPRKGLRMLLRALQKMSSFRFQLLLVGANLPDVDLPDTTIYLGATDSVCELSKFYRASDIVVVPSLSDNMPNVVLEAMASGCAILASDVAGIPDIIHDRKTGLLCKPGSVDELIEKLSVLINNAPLRGLLGNKAREFALETLSLETEFGQYQKLYDQMVSGKQ